jgi:fucose permease
MGGFSLGLSAKIVMRFGIKAPLATGMALVTVGLLLFARAPVGGSFLVDVLPAMLVLGVGVGLAFNPVLLAATNDIDPREAGLASGVANTSFMMGGALGLAVLASLAASKTASLQTSGHAAAAALNGGYHAAFVVGALFAAAACVGAIVLRRPASSQHADVADGAHVSEDADGADGADGANERSVMAH